MKKKFLQIAKLNGLEITDYKSYRSDMGCQVFDMVVKFPNGKLKTHTDSYWVGEDGSKEKVISYFQDTFIPCNKEKHCL